MKFKLLIENKILKNNDVPFLKHLDAVCIVKMPTMISILTFMNSLNIRLSCVGDERSFITPVQQAHALTSSYKF